MKRNLLFSAVAATAFLFSTHTSHGCTLSCKYDAVLSATQHLVNPVTTRDISAQNPEHQVEQVASAFAQVPGENEATIYPVGTIVDRAEISSNTLTVWLTFPASTETNSLSDFNVYHGHEILRYYFADALNLNGVTVRARSGEGADYVDIEDYIFRETPASATAPRDAAPLDYEIGGVGPQPDIDLEPIYERIRQEAAMGTRDVPGQGNASSSGMPHGALAGKIIFTYGGHGRTWNGSSWGWQREYWNGILEDFGNTDASDYYAQYAFNAGATVVSFRPIGYQNNEVVIDNTSPGFSRQGAWNNSVNPRFYGSGTPNYYWINSANTETATATYTPNIPEAGYYPVYTWANFGSDRIPGGQLYRIRSTGGESLVRIDHRRVGCGWVYLGTHYFEAGSNPATGSVVISNQNPPGITGAYTTVADAIRFGNGMGTANNGGGVSGYSRREESTVYWNQNAWGNGNNGVGDWSAASIWSNNNSSDDQPLSWNSPPRMAAQMYRLHGGNADKLRYALYIGWHTNGSNGAARGSMGLITGRPTPNQDWWAKAAADELDAASLEEDENWEHNWWDRPATYSGGYSEIDNDNLLGEMDATIIESGYHDNPQDAALLLDPKVRSVHARGVYRAAVRYFNYFHGDLLHYLPERPQRFRVKNNGGGSITLNWAPGLTGDTRGQIATSYRLYQSPDGLGWGGGEAVTGTAKTITGLTPGQIYYFRVAGVNAGGESFPTETLAVRIPPSGGAKVLIVNGFDRLDRFNNVLRPAGIGGIPQQLNPFRNNTYNYVLQHAQAVAAAGRDFDSTSNEAVISGDVNLNDYDTVIWMLGEESSRDFTFNATERTRTDAFLAAGKNLFISGSEIGYEQDSLNRGRTFYRNSLRAQYVSDSSLSYTAHGAAGSIFQSISALDFAPGDNMYDVDSADVIVPSGGSITALTYGAPAGVTLDTFDSTGSWWQPSASGSTTADDSTFAIVSSPRRQGTGSGRLNYNWSAGTNLRLHNAGSSNFPKNSRLSLWVYGDNSGHTFRLWLRDPADAELFETPVININWTGWQELAWNLPTTPLTRAHGSGDNAITGNDIRLDSVFMTKAGTSNVGNIYLDDASYTPVTDSTANRTAAVQYAGTYKLVHLAFPFEAISNSMHREQLMESALNFFEQPTSSVSDWSMY